IGPPLPGVRAAMGMRVRVRGERRCSAEGRLLTLPLSSADRGVGTGGDLLPRGAAPSTERSCPQERGADRRAGGKTGEIGDGGAAAGRRRAGGPGVGGLARGGL